MNPLNKAFVVKMVLIAFFATSGGILQAAGQTSPSDDDFILDLPVPGTASAAQNLAGDPELVLPMPNAKNPLEEDGDPGKPSDERPILHLPPNKGAGKTTASVSNQPPTIEIPFSQKRSDPLSAQDNVPNKPAAPTNTQPAVNAKNGDLLPSFPKDTSSAIFMVMKTWECTDYDGKILIEHAIGVYSKEAEDPFEIKGLKDLPPIKITLKEDDVTLDELLDSVSAKTGIDWGVDIAQKALYLYPKKPQ
ncbi:MAG: hypothetical protein WA705_24970 [Candidatus Ozemobacteraceae bacterium]